MLALASLGAATQADLVPPPPEIAAEAAILVQAQSGAVLYEKNALDARPPASLTKMITALVVSERCDPAEIATSSATAAAAPETRLGLAQGDRIAVGELLRALMIPSANDAALCLAEHLGGSEAAFAELMNAKAKELGATNTHFVNASGLTAKGHYSCARDLAVFAMAVRLDPRLAPIVRRPTATVTWCNGREEEVWNRNRLLTRFRGCDGVKTGFTTPAGRCLAASAARDGCALVSVVLHSSDSWAESAALLNWGFAQPPVAVVRLPARLDSLPGGIPAPLVRGRLYVPVADFMSAQGFAVETRGDVVIARADAREFAFSAAEGLVVDGAKQALSADLLTWRGQLVSPTTDICRLLGLRLSFDQRSLTVSVGPSPGG